MWLGELAHAASGGEPETAGLRALMLYVDARSEARRALGEDGAPRYVPLEDQDPGRWDHAMIREAEELLHEAALARAPGRFQLEAAIQSAHVRRVLDGRSNWLEIEVFYEHLLGYADTLGARVAHLSAMAEARGAEVAYGRLLELPRARVREHQAYWALRAHLERETGRDAEGSLERAVGLSADPAGGAVLLE